MVINGALRVFGTQSPLIFAKASRLNKRQVKDEESSSGATSNLQLFAPVKPKTVAPCHLNCCKTKDTNKAASQGLKRYYPG